MKISTSQFYNAASRQMIENQNRLTEVQAELASGKKNLNTSDSPDKVSMLHRVNGLLVNNQSYLNNIESANQRLQIQETSIRTASNLLIRLREIATQFSNSTYTSAQRQSAASEVVAIRDQLLGLANSKDAHGKSVFAGSLNGRNAYTSAGVYQGDQLNISVEIGESFHFETLRSGTSVFKNIVREKDSPGEQSVGFFQVINDLSDALGDSNLDKIRSGINEIQSIPFGAFLAVKLRLNLNAEIVY